MFDNIEKMLKVNSSIGHVPKIDSIDRIPSSIDGYGLIDNAEYLLRCQVDTPNDIVSVVWGIAHTYRPRFGSILDAGAGDGRFAKLGNYENYVGYEIDPRRDPISDLPENAKIVRACAFSEAENHCYDLSIGNPPYVRHHDLSDAWRKNISDWIQDKTGERPHGLSNAYLYFLWLSMISTRDDGLVALVVPFEWVARPAAAKLRQYIASKGWSLDVYQFDVEPFPRVLTTASVTVIDKRCKSGRVRYFGIDKDGNTRPVRSPTRSNRQPLSYRERRGATYAQRGLSPGGQKVFILTEEERVRHGLVIDCDVVRCVTSMKHIDRSVRTLTEVAFQRNYVETGKRCWLIWPGDDISARLRSYLEAVPKRDRDNYTCKTRDVWWKFALPIAPRLLYSSGFRGDTPKVLLNAISAVSVGSVCGIHADSNTIALQIEEAIRNVVLKREVVAISRGFTKIEVNQMNEFIHRTIG